MFVVDSTGIGWKTNHAHRSLPFQSRTYPTGCMAEPEKYRHSGSDFRYMVESLCASERLLKIDQHLMKLTETWWLTFSNHPVYWPAIIDKCRHLLSDYRCAEVDVGSDDAVVDWHLSSTVVLHRNFGIVLIALHHVPHCHQLQQQQPTGLLHSQVNKVSICERPQNSIV